MEVIDSNEFIRSYIGTYDSNFVKKFCSDGLRAWVKREIENERLSLNSEHIIKSRLIYFSSHFSGLNEKDFTEQQVDVGTEKFLMGIRFLNGNPEEPFVDVISTREISCKEQIFQAQEIAWNAFHVFRPKFIQIWLSPEQKVENVTNGEFTPGRRVIAGFFKDLSMDVPCDAIDLSLHRVENEEYYSWYEKTYHEFHKKFPQFKDWIPLNEKSIMEECRSEDLLYWVKKSKEWVGLVGATQSSLLGKQAVYMDEILIKSEFKGRGLAPLIQKMFLNRLKSRFDLVWGTIDAKNTPSTKTALRVGRVSIREEFFLPLN